MTDPIRLSKRLIALTGCSRREAELYIEGGWVTVDGRIVDEPQYKVQSETVELLPGASATPLEPITLILHQPSGAIEGPDALLQLLRPDTHWSEDPAQKRVLKGHFARLNTSLPLQPGAQGLTLFTQDWRTLRKLTDDAAKLEQEYVAEVRGETATNGLERLKRGHTHKGLTLPACKVSWQSETRLRFAMKNPAPGIIRQMCESIGLQVITLKRIRIGGVPMGKLPAGQWRYLSSHERF
ncbi:23S rRNA pseudouridine2604 synthase [Pseudomonas duriflava]|uniref:Dual-specificity RNA pseudouridine synthase RluF n=1 Tax=Pseudomonas duriflava TaxID=459528 RepID=A0A562QAI5_9PSED|nr:rRNA pseudouridine synthase [Pseudomonas duriflava]TWI53180.1 23S rRNA pseudouridine2604 synthase [Pseudomonas duriflava]